MKNKQYFLHKLILKIIDIVRNIGGYELIITRL